MAGVGRYLVEAHLREGRPVAALATEHGVHRSWLYKLLARYRALGEAGLVLRSRRPRRSPAAMAPSLADEIVASRTNLLAQGLDGVYLYDVATVSPDGSRESLDHTDGLLIPGKRIRLIRLLAP